MKKILIAIAVICAGASCSNYYKAITTKGPATASGIGELTMKHKYFILRDTGMAYAMNDISLAPDKKSIRCNLVSVTDDHSTYLWKRADDKPKYNKSKYAGVNEAFVLNEVHLYTTQNGNMAPGPFSLPLSNVEKMEVIEKDKKRTTNSHVIGGVSIAVGMAAVALGIAAAVFASGWWN